MKNLWQPIKQRVFRIRWTRRGPDAEAALTNKFVYRFTWLWARAMALLGDRVLARRALNDATPMYLTLENDQIEKLRSRRRENGVDRRSGALARWGGRPPALRNPASIYPIDRRFEVALFIKAERYEREKRDRGDATEIDGGASVGAALLLYAYNGDRPPSGADVVITGIASVGFGYDRHVGLGDIWTEVMRQVPERTRPRYLTGEVPFEEIFQGAVAAVRSRLGVAVTHDETHGVVRKTTSRADVRITFFNDFLGLFTPGNMACNSHAPATSDEDEGEDERVVHDDALRGHAVAHRECREQLRKAFKWIPDEPERTIVATNLPKDPSDGADRLNPAAPTEKELELVRAYAKDLIRKQGLAGTYPLEVRVDGEAERGASDEINNCGRTRFSVPSTARLVEVWAPDETGKPTVCLTEIPVVRRAESDDRMLAAGQYISVEFAPLGDESGERRVEVEIFYDESDWARRAILRSDRALAAAAPRIRAVRRALTLGWLPKPVLIPARVVAVALVGYLAWGTFRSTYTRFVPEPPTMASSGPVAPPPTQTPANANEEQPQVVTGDDPKDLLVPNNVERPRRTASKPPAKRGAGPSRGSTAPPPQITPNLLSVAYEILGDAPITKAVPLYNNLKRADDLPQGTPDVKDEIGIVAPDGWAVRDRRVLLDWDPVEWADSQVYQVVIRRADDRPADQPVVPPQEVVGRTWLLTPPLPEGRDYAWTVTTKVKGREVGTFDEIRFRVLGARDLETLRAADVRFRDRPVDRAAVYAVLGLAAEAEEILIDAGSDVSTRASAEALRKKIRDGLGRIPKRGERK